MEEEKVLPKEIIQMIASGLAPKDILSLCQTDTYLNRVVCENPDFYRALGRRDFPDWHYPVLPEVILPMELAKRNDDWLDGTPVYWGRSEFEREPYRVNARLPGTGNTVKIHDEEYVWYYFMWAPRDHRLVNYNKKFTDEEILEDIRRGKKVEMNTIDRGTGPFGLSGKRKMLLVRNMGILTLRSLERLAELATMDLSSAEKMRDAGVYWSLFNIFTPGYQARELLPYNLLNPRVLKDLSLEYDSSPDSVSLALLASLAAQKKKTLARDEYAQLVEKYNILEQLRALKEDLPNLSLEPKERMLCELNSMLNIHEDLDRERRLRDLVLPQSESLWPEALYQEILSVRQALHDAVKP